MEIQRTFWVQVNTPLIYAASTDPAVVPGSPTGMSLTRLVRAERDYAQLVSSLTVGKQHAPVLDVDFPACTVVHGQMTVLRVNGVAPDSKRLSRLGKQLINCSFASPSAVERFLTTSSLPPQVTIPFTVPIRLLPSSSPGHHHLYIEAETSWGRYRRLLLALCCAGVIGEDFSHLSVESGASFLRAPGVRKE